jgi:hypothetical protein
MVVDYFELTIALNVVDFFVLVKFDGFVAKFQTHTLSLKSFNALIRPVIEPCGHSAQPKGDGIHRKRAPFAFIDLKALATHLDTGQGKDVLGGP